MSEPSVAPARAVVHAGGVVTPYLRAGHGEAIVVVTTNLEHEDLLHTVSVLSREFLVLAAAPALPERAGVSQWLPGFLECLGVAHAHLFLHGDASAILTGSPLNA